LILLGLGLGVWASVRWWRRTLRTGQAIALPFLTLAVSLVLTVALFAPGCSSVMLGARSAVGTEVLDRKTVGVFATTTLTARDAPALRLWLTENGFAAPASIDPVVTELLDEGWVFVASKVRTKAGRGVARTRCRFAFPRGRPSTRCG